MARPKTCPEILPFVDRNEDEERQYETSWSEHVAQLEKLFCS